MRLDPILECEALAMWRPNVLVAAFGLTFAILPPHLCWQANSEVKLTARGKKTCQPRTKPSCCSDMRDVCATFFRIHVFHFLFRCWASAFSFSTARKRQRGFHSFGFFPSAPLKICPWMEFIFSQLPNRWLSCCLRTSRSF